MSRFLALFVPLLLAACGSDGDAGAGGVTRGEARALNEAAAMLDANSVSPEAVGIAAEEEGE